MTSQFTQQQRIEPNSDLPLAAMLVSILSLFCCGLGFFSDIVSLILSILALRKHNDKVMSIIALVLTIIGLVLNGIVAFWIIPNWFYAALGI